MCKRGGAVNAIPATVGDLALGLSGKADAGHCHPVEDVAGLGEALERNPIPAVDVEIEFPTNGTYPALTVGPGLYYYELSATCEESFTVSSGDGIDIGYGENAELSTNSTSTTNGDVRIGTGSGRWSSSSTVYRKKGVRLFLEEQEVSFTSYTLNRKPVTINLKMTKI